MGGFMVAEALIDTQWCRRLIRSHKRQTLLNTLTHVGTLLIILKCCIGAFANHPVIDKVSEADSISI